MARRTLASGGYEADFRHRRPPTVHVFSVNSFNLGGRLYRKHLSFIKELAPEIGRGVRFGYTFASSRNVAGRGIARPDPCRYAAAGQQKAKPGEHPHPLDNGRQPSRHSKLWPVLSDGKMGNRRHG